MIPNDWFEWSSTNHIEEAQRLCDAAMEIADGSPESVAMPIWLKVARVHSTLALACRVNELSRILNMRLPENLS